LVELEEEPQAARPSATASAASREAATAGVRVGITTFCIENMGMSSPN
jgi:hypothetical protein